MNSPTGCLNNPDHPTGTLPVRRERRVVEDDHAGWPRVDRHIRRHRLGLAEFDPARKWTRTAAFREGLLRERINKAAKACTLPCRGHGP